MATKNTTKPVDLDEAIKWIKSWCAAEGLKLNLKGECGFGRECVGVEQDDTYPDYVWYDDEYNRIDGNGDVFVPEKAYHKHPCVAVLGRDEESIMQLYQWLKWFKKNNFHYKMTKVECKDPIDLLFGRNKKHQMVKETPKKKTKKT